MKLDRWMTTASAIASLLCSTTLARAATPDELVQAAAAGDAASERQLGWMTYRGEGVPRDVGKGLEWLAKAADHGDAQAQYDLGVITYNGRDVRQDFGKAFDLFSKASQQGNLDARYNMAVMYRGGQGVAEDHAKAFELYADTAGQGVKNAQISLCGMYLFGDSVPRDLVKADTWCLLADLVDGTQLKGNAVVASASHSAPIERQMTSDQIASARRQADEWLATRGLRRVGIVTHPR